MPAMVKYWADSTKIDREGVFIRLLLRCDTANIASRNIPRVILREPKDLTGLFA